MNAWVLSNLRAKFHRNEQKAIARARKNTKPKWYKLHVVWCDTLKILKPTLVKLAFSHIQFLGMTAWGVGFIPFNVQVKVECDEDFAIMI
jgi:hypothetical protein